MAPATPVKPKAAAIIARIKNVRIHESITFSLFDLTTLIMSDRVARNNKPKLGVFIASVFKRAYKDPYEIL